MEGGRREGRERKGVEGVTIIKTEQHHCMHVRMYSHSKYPR